MRRGGRVPSLILGFLVLACGQRIQAQNNAGQPHVASRTAFSFLEKGPIDDVHCDMAAVEEVRDRLPF